MHAIKISAKTKETYFVMGLIYLVKGRNAKLRILSVAAQSYTFLIIYEENAAFFKGMKKLQSNFSFFIFRLIFFDPEQHINV